jgi:hypothetical protein
MPITLIASTDTLEVFRSKTNQTINVVNNLLDGALVVNGSITFANSSFALGLPSMNVSNNIVMTAASGNTLFLQSSNAVINGTIFLTGSGNSLQVSNDVIIYGNSRINGRQTIGGNLIANSVSSNSSISSQTLNVTGNASVGNISTTTLTVGNIVSSGNLSLTKLTAANSLITNINGTTLMLSGSGTMVGSLVVGGAITATGNVTGNYSIANHSIVYGTSVVTGHVSFGSTLYTNGNIKSSGSITGKSLVANNNITANDIDISRHANISGTLTVTNPISTSNATSGQEVVTYNQFNTSLAEDGWLTMPNGLTFQWGKESVTLAGNIATISFPKTFNSVYTILPTNGSSTTSPHDVGLIGNSGTQFIVNVPDQATGTYVVAWFAVGKVS